MVSVDKFKDITWSVGADGTIITDDVTNVQQIEEFLACKDSPTLLRLWIERYGGEWNPEYEYVRYDEATTVSA